MNRMSVTLRRTISVWLTFLALVTCASTVESTVAGTPTLLSFAPTTVLAQPMVDPVTIFRGDTTGAQQDAHEPAAQRHDRLDNFPLNRGAYLQVLDAAGSAVLQILRRQICPLVVLHWRR